MTVPGVMDMEYRFPSQNNGQIYQQKDWISGEEVTYAYDSLNRLISAVTTDPAWGQGFSYDGFGNRTAATVTKGSAPMSSLNFDSATNRILGSGFSYDANGNTIAMPNISTINYDVENRVASLIAGAGQELYNYALDNKRIWKRMPSGTEEFYFYGITRQKLGTYRIGIGSSGYGMFVLDTNLYFASKVLRSRGSTVVSDRSRSVRNSGGTVSRYFPYGEEQQVTAQDRDKFGAYYRDSTSGLDYAQNRYYANTLGRFLTPDPNAASATLGSPSSLNRYTYAVGDPVNRFDPSGLCDNPEEDEDGNCDEAEKGITIAGQTGSFVLPPDIGPPIVVVNVTCPPSCGSDPPIYGIFGWGDPIIQTVGKNVNGFERDWAFLPPEPYSQEG